MATLRCTSKYRKAFRLPEKLPEPVDPPSNLGEWYGNTLSIGRQRFVHYMTGKSLLSVIVPLRESKTAELRMVPVFKELLLSFGIAPAAVEREVAAVRKFEHARASNRSVLASMRDQASVAKNAVLGGRASSVWQIMLDLASMPCGALGYSNPKRATLSLLANNGAG